MAAFDDFGTNSNVEKSKGLNGVSDNSFLPDKRVVLFYKRGIVQSIGIFHARGQPMFRCFGSPSLEVLLLDVPLIRRGTVVVVLHMSPEKQGFGHVREF